MGEFMVYSGSYSFIKEQLKNHIKEIYKEHSGYKIPKISIVVLSNQMKTFLKEYLTKELGILVNTEFFTMIDISKKITNIEPLQDFDKEMILNKFLLENGYLSDGLASEFNLLLQQLKEYQIPFENIKSPFVKNIISEYEQFKEENGYYDREDVHKLAVSSETDFYTDYLILFGIRSIPELYQMLIKKLKQLSPNLDVFIQLIDNSGYMKKQPHFQQVKDFYKTVAGNIVIETIQDPNLVVSKNIYNDNFDIKEFKNENIKIISSKNEKEELENIIQSILEIKQKGTDWDKIGIILPDIQKYIPFIREIFGKYHIPYYLTEENRFIDEPFFKKIFSLFEIKERNFTKESVLNLLSDDLLNIQNISDVEKAILESAVSEGFKDWNRFLFKKEKFSDLKQLLEKIDSLPKEAEIKDFIDSYKEISDKFIKNEQGKEFLSQIFEELEQRRLYNLLFDKISHQDFSKIIKSFFYQENKENRKKGNTITILKPLTAEGNNFEYIFFLNLNMESFPNPLREEILAEAEELNNQDYPYHLLMQELLSFCSIFDKNKKIFLSCIKESIDGKEKLPSTFLDEIQRILYPESYFKGEEKYEKIPKNYWTIKDFYIKYAKSVAQIDKYLKNLWERLEKMLNLELKDFILSEFEPNLPVYATKFQKYVQCPYKFFLEEVVKVEELEEIDRKSISPLEKGILIHEILEKFYKKIDINKISDVEKFVESQKKNLRKQFFEGIGDLKGFNGMIELLLPSYRPFEEAKAEETFERLIAFIKEDISYLKRTQRTVDKSLLEKRLPSKNLSKEIDWENEKNVKKYYIKDFAGRVDRVDKDQSGNYYLYDYKTGESKIYSIQKEILTKFIQLLIYKRLLEAEGKNIKKVGILAVNQKDRNFRKEVDSSDIEELYPFIDTALQKLKEGYFPPIENDYCQYCQFEQFCIKNVGFSFED